MTATAATQAADAARKMTNALFLLEREYEASADEAEKACARAVHRVNFSLPDYSKARLYQILMAA